MSSKNKKNIPSERHKDDLEKIGSHALGLKDNKALEYELFNQMFSFASESDKEHYEQYFLAQTGVLEEFDFKDHLERLLAVQMLGTHKLAVTCLARSQIYTDPCMVDKKLNQANKLLRTFTAQLEALNRHRGKGQQKMTVEHVHVNQGGQAIIGPVNKKEGGGKSK